MSLSVVWTIAWVPTYNIAKLCPSEYMSWFIMRQKYNRLTRYKIVEWVLWDNEYTDNEIKEELEYKGPLSGEEIKEEISIKYHNLVNSLKEKTGLSFEMFHEAEDLEIISKPVDVNNKELYSKMQDMSEDIWIFDYDDSNTLKKDLDITMVMCSY